MSGTIIIPSAERWLILPSNKGSAGAAGPPGSGSTIAVQDEGSALGAATVTTLNITGPGATATRSGAVVTIDVEGGGDASIIYLANHGVVADGTTVNSAAAVSALIAGLARGTVVQLPNGHAKFDGSIDIDVGVIIRGYGRGPSRASSGSVVEFPAGSNGFHPRNGTEAGNSIGGFGTILEGFWLYLPGNLTSTAVGSYNGTTGISITGGTITTANKQVVLVEGASTPVQLPDRKYASTSGSTTLTPTIVPKDFLGGTPYYGNHVGYPGMVLTGTGIPAGTTMTPGIASAITLSANATATNTGLDINIVPPILSLIQSGGGTSSLTVDDPTYGVSVTGMKVRHCPAGIYGTCGRVVVRDVYFDMPNQGAGVVLQGHTSGGQVTDSWKFYNCDFNCADFNVVTQGTDAAVHGFYGCKFDGAQMHVIDNSEFGQTFVDCEWAFNVGILVVQITAQTKLYGGYFESGTSWIAPIVGLCTAYDVVSMVSGSGWAVTRAQGGVKITGPTVAESLDAFNGLQVRGSHPTYIQTPISGTPFNADLAASPCLAYGNAGAGFGNWIISYATPNAAYEKLHIEGTEVWFGTTFNTADLGKMDANGFKLPSGKGYYVNGTQVVGAQQTGTPADATDLATALTLLNAMKAKLIAHGLLA